MVSQASQRPKGKIRSISGRRFGDFKVPVRLFLASYSTASCRNQQTAVYQYHIGVGTKKPRVIYVLFVLKHVHPVFKQNTNAFLRNTIGDFFFEYLGNY